jgi:amino acid transporter/nucleotide-binding universal stress UspA family protein
MNSDFSSSTGTKTEFAKELGLKEAISIAIGAMIGGGIFSVLGRLAGIAGPAAVLSFFFGGVIAFLTSNSYYRLISKYPSAGGEFVILRRGFENPMVGNSIGAMLWLGYSVTIALYAFTFGLYTSEFLHDTTDLHFFDVHNNDLLTGRKVFAFSSIFLFMMINLRGVKETGTVQNVIVAFKLAVLLFIGVLGLIYFNGNNYSPFTLNDNPYGSGEDFFGGFSGIVIGSAVIFVSYEGYQVIANTVEEMKNPARDVKIGMYISVITVAVTYCVVTIATFSLVDKDEVIDEAALIQAVEFLGPWAVLLITLGAAASTTSAINATLLGSSRLAYVMSDWHAFPKKLAVISKKSKVPYLAIITTSAISWFFTFFGNAEEIAEVGSIIFLGIFLSINLAVLKIFPNDRNLIAKIASVLIVIYIFLVFGFFFTHLDESFLALMVLTVFIVTTLLWMFINQRIQKGVDIDTAKYELEPLGKELIQEFVPSRGRTDDFFIDLERMLVPVAGLKFETQNWQVSALIARKYNVQVTILHIGKDESKLDKPKAVFDKYNVKYDVILRQRNSRTVASEIINTYHEGSYQLINLASRRKKRWLDRLLDTSVSKKVVDSVDATILQVHPPKYGQSREDIANMFLLLDGTERDTFLGRWANIVSSAGVKSKIFAYHVVQIPQTISLEDAAEFPEVKQSAREFEAYSRGITDGLGLNATPTLLYGHNFVKSLVLATQMHEPDAVLIGHTKDVGLWNRIRTRLAYRIMNKVDSAVIVHHMGENQNGNETS